MASGTYAGVKGVYFGVGVLLCFYPVTFATDHSQTIVQSSKAAVVVAGNDDSNLWQDGSLTTAVLGRVGRLVADDATDHKVYLTAQDAVLSSLTNYLIKIVDFSTGNVTTIVDSVSHAPVRLIESYLSRDYGCLLYTSPSPRD